MPNTVSHDPSFNIRVRCLQNIARCWDVQCTLTRHYITQNLIKTFLEQIAYIFCNTRFFLFFLDKCMSSNRKEKRSWRPLFSLSKFKQSMNLESLDCINAIVGLFCQYLVKYLPGFLKKKTKDIDIFYTNKKCLIKFNVD